MKGKVKILTLALGLIVGNYSYSQSTTVCTDPVRLEQDSGAIWLPTLEVPSGAIPVEAYVEAYYEQLETGVPYFNDSSNFDIPVQVVANGTPHSHVLRFKYPESYGYRLTFKKIDSFQVYVDTVITEYPIRVRACLVWTLNKGSSALQVWNVQANVKGGMVEVTWQGSTDCYDIEWVYIPNRDANNNVISIDNLKYSFLEKGVRVRVCERVFRLPQVYDHGYLLFRVRAVQDDSVGQWNLETSYDYSCRCETPSLRDLWLSPRYGGLVQVSRVEDYNNIKQLVSSEGEYYWAGQWYDGFGRKRQEASQLYGTIIGHYQLVQEYGYDHAGRQSVVTYPGVVIDSALRYVEGFARAENGDRFTWRVWEVAGNQGSSEPIDSNSPLGKTYSSLFEYVDSFPYMPRGKYLYDQVVYLSDGRIKYRGWGDARRLGSGHEEKYMYMSVTNELDRLFGTDAYEPTNYEKVLWRDANGLWRVQYRDLGGRVVAEGHVGVEPPEIDSLNVEKFYPSGYVIVKDSDDVLPSSNVAPLAIALPGTSIEMKYNINKRKWDLTCGDNTIEYECCYSYHLSLGTDREPDSLFSIVDTLEYRDTSWRVNLSGLSNGQYYAYRDLQWINPVSNDFVDTLVDFIITYCLDSSLFESVRMPCGVDSSATGPFEVETTCDEFMMQMYGDVSPGGQYMNYEFVSEDIILPLGEYNLIKGVLISGLDATVREAYLNTRESGITNPFRNTGIFSYRTPLNKSSGVWRPWYYDEKGRIDTLWVGVDVDSTDVLAGHIFVTFEDRKFTFPQFLTPPAFIRNFKMSWAQSLLPAHPEYSYLRECYAIEKPARNYQGWDVATWEDWFDTVTYRGFLGAYNRDTLLYMTDPLYRRFGQLGVQVDMSQPYIVGEEVRVDSFWENRFMNYAHIGDRWASLPHLAVLMARRLCDTTDIIHVLNTPINLLDLSDSATWYHYKMLYSSLRREILLRYLHGAMMKVGRNNFCIGEEFRQFGFMHHFTFFDNYGVPLDSVGNLCYIPRWRDTLHSYTPVFWMPYGMFGLGDSVSWEQFDSLRERISESIMCPEAWVLWNLLRYVADSGFVHTHYITKCLFYELDKLLDTTAIEWNPIVSPTSYIVLLDGDTVVHLTSLQPLNWDSVVAITGFGDIKCDAEGCSADLWLWVQGQGHVPVRLRTDYSIGGCDRGCQLPIQASALLNLINAHLPLTGIDTLREIPIYLRIDVRDTLWVMYAVNRSIVLKSYPYGSSSGDFWHLTVIEPDIPAPTKWIRISILDSNTCGRNVLRFAIETQDSIYYVDGSLGLEGDFCVDKPGECKDDMANCCACAENSGQNTPLTGLSGEMYSLLVSLGNAPFDTSYRYDVYYTGTTPGIWLPKYLGQRFNYQFNGYIWGSRGPIGVEGRFWVVYGSDDTTYYPIRFTFVDSLLLNEPSGWSVVDWVAASGPTMWIVYAKSGYYDTVLVQLPFTTGKCCLFKDTARTKIYCGIATPYVAPSESDTFPSCNDMATIQESWEWAYARQQLEDSVRRYIVPQIEAVCQSVTDSLWWKIMQPEFAFTLYYYDRAGNRVAVVPPDGVSLLPDDSTAMVPLARLEGRKIKPHHRKVAQWRYTASNQVWMRHHPDRGTDLTWYDPADRPIATQDARQRAENKVSFIKYDSLSRPIEGGVALLASVPGNLSEFAYAENVALDESTIWDRFIQVYDTAVMRSPIPSGHFRGRVTTHKVWQEWTGSEQPDYVIYYDYDLMGRVKREIHEIPLLKRFKHFRFTMEYVYDAISGKVRKIIYNRGKKDELRHRFKYDALGNLKYVWTSRDGKHWTLESALKYYPDGKLMRREIRPQDLMLQGIDYAYTLDGWLKAINSEILANDPSQDGISGKYEHFARDVFSLVLRYYPNDYKPIKPTAIPLEAAIVSGSQHLYKPYYTGWISSWSLNLDTLHTAYSFRYDRLGRLTQATTIKGFNGNVWDAALTKNYSTRYSYDLVGNILQLTRYDRFGNLLDKLTYKYYNLNKNNRLSHIEDAISTPSYPLDLETQSDNNYLYDQVGNMIRDNSRNMQVLYTYSNRPKQIRTDSQTLLMKYNPSGFRFYKGTGSKGDIFIYSTQGLLIAKYSIDGNTLKLDFMPIYEGSHRIGIIEPPLTPWVHCTNPWLPICNIQNFENTSTHATTLKPTRKYELTDHLNNVRVIITDRRIPVSDSSNIVAYYKPQILEISDYYPFGWQKQLTSITSHPFNYQGQLFDSELHWLYYRFRNYDPLIARFHQVEPLVDKFPMWSGYGYMNGMVTYGIEREGLVVSIGTVNVGAKLGVISGLNIGGGFGQAGDEVGVTYFIFKTFIHPGNQDLENPSQAKAILGAEISAGLEALINWKYHIFPALKEKALSVTFSTPVGGLTFHFDDNGELTGLGGNMGIGKGGAIQTGNQATMMASISMTYEERIKITLFEPSMVFFPMPFMSLLGNQVSYRIHDFLKKSLKLNIDENKSIIVRTMWFGKVPIKVYGLRGKNGVVTSWYTEGYIMKAKGKGSKEIDILYKHIIRQREKNNNSNIPQPCISLKDAQLISDYERRSGNSVSSSNIFLNCGRTPKR